MSGGTVPTAPIFAPAATAWSRRLLAAVSAALMNTHHYQSGSGLPVPALLQIISEYADRIIPVVERIAGSKPGQSINAATGLASSWNSAIGLARVRITSKSGAGDRDWMAVADCGGHSIRLIDLSPPAITPLPAGSAVCEVAFGTRQLTGSLKDFPQFQDAKFRYPRMLYTNPRNLSQLFVTDETAVYVLDLSSAADGGGKCEVLAGEPGVLGDRVGAACTRARFHFPVGLCLTSDGQHLLVCDSANQRIKSIDLKARAVSVLTGQYGPGGKSHLPKPSCLTRCQLSQTANPDTASSKQEEVYYVTASSQIHRLVIKVVAPEPGDDDFGSSSSTISATSLSPLTAPSDLSSRDLRDIVSMKSGLLIVADMHNKRVVCLHPITKCVVELAGSGSVAGFGSSDDSSASSRPLRARALDYPMPSAVALHLTENEHHLWISDPFDHLVLRLTLPDNLSLDSEQFAKL